MAIPMSGPAYEERELEAMLEHLLIVIRQIVDVHRRRRLRRMLLARRHFEAHESVRPSAIHVPVSVHTPDVLRSHEEPIHQPPPPPAPETVAATQNSASSLPDLLTDVTVVDCRTRKRNQTQASYISWTQTGTDLRHIANAFEQLRTPDENNRRNRTPAVTKDLNLLSTLCPMLVNTLWPMLAFVVGWNLLSRSR